MALSPGTKLGSYEIVAPLGAGGMGEVYRAKDSRLGREVALKVLPERMAADAERMGRFEREAKLLASLNHPNIATIYGLEDSGGVHAFIMELVEGPTLADRIRSGALPLDEALPLARQICEGLEYAHERGIVHRDLKPANVKITPDGAVKILDFGLAKALVGDASSADISSSPTISRMATESGVILGTAAYMSPEQAKGKSVDRRTDIWAFGCVFYEMLTGQMAFSGETVTDVLASVIKGEPDWTKLPAAAPARVRELLHRCLTKDSRERVQAIGDARIAIEETLSGAADSPLAGQGYESGTGDYGPLPHPGRRILPWGVAALASIAFLITLGMLWRAPRSAPPVPLELSLSLPSAQQLFTNDGPAVVLSSDGSRVAYVVETSPGRDQIYVRDLEHSEATPLEGAEGTSPFFSPDGQWVGFFGMDGKLKKISVFGGGLAVLCTADSHRGGSWSGDGTIVFSTTVTSPLYKVPASGGAPVEVTHLDAGKAEVTHRWPQVLPGGKWAVFTASADNNNFEHADVEAASLSTGQAKVLVENAYFGRYLPSGYLTYVSGGTLFAVPFDPEAVKLTGASKPVLPNIEADLTNGGAQLSFSSTGAAVYMTGQAMRSQMSVALVDRKGAAVPLVQEPGDYFAPRFSPDGKRLALQEGIGNVWVYDMDRATLTPLTFSTPQCIIPVWTPDGKRITCSRPSAAGEGPGISWLSSDGAGHMESLTQGSKVLQFPFSWTPDGMTLALSQVAAQSGGCCEIWMLPVNAGGQPGQAKQFLKLESPSGGAYAPDFSPDGRWLAYDTYVSGVRQVYVVPYPEPGGKWQVSVLGGSYPRWSRSGHELFFIQGARGRQRTLARITYSVEGNSFVPGKPEALFQGEFEPRDPFPFYDVAPDGQHFATLHSVGGNQAAPEPPTVVVNWFTRVEQMVTAGQK